MMDRLRFGGKALLVAMCIAGSAPGAENVRVQEPTLFASWQAFHKESDGLPDNRIRSLRVDGERLWVGTMGGVALHANGRWQAWTGEDGAPRRRLSGKF